MVSTDKAVAMTGFFEEVRRRKVYRVAAAYIIAAGGIIQLAAMMRSEEHTSELQSLTESRMPSSA